MSVLDRLGRKKRAIPANATFRLTQEGVEKLQAFGNDAKSRILAALETRGSSGVTEIAQASNLSRGKVERLLPGLVEAGYVQYRSPSMSGMEDD
ncbi:MAG: helix-turn-helix domain-containing protein [Candidatus Bathyanammoxibius sp.]